MKPLVQIGFLIDQHVDWYKKYKQTDEEVTYARCEGCPMCKQIDQLSLANGLKIKNGKEKQKKIVRPKKDIGITKEELKSLLDTGKTVKEIAREKKLVETTLRKRAREWFPGLLEKQKEVFGKNRYTKEQVAELWDAGTKNKSEIARIVGISPATLDYHIKKWEESGFKLGPKPEKEEKPKRKVEPQLAEVVKPKETVKGESKDLVKEMENKLVLADEETAKVEEMKFVTEMYEADIMRLKEKIKQLEEENKNLHAAANDTEKEAAAAIEYMEKEEQLLLDADSWKYKALTWERENQILNETNRELNSWILKFREETKAARAYIKAVL